MDLWLLPQPLGILGLLCLEIYWSSFATVILKWQVAFQDYKTPIWKCRTFIQHIFFFSFSLLFYMYACLFSLDNCRIRLGTLKEHNVFTYFIILSHTVLIIFFRIFPPLYYPALIAGSREVFVFQLSRDMTLFRTFFPRDNNVLYKHIQPKNYASILLKIRLEMQSSAQRYARLFSCRFYCSSELAKGS